MSIEISECTAVTPDVVDAFVRLTPQLSSSNPPPSADALAAVVASPAAVLFLARDGDEIVGSLTLVLFRIPIGGLRAWIEDVVVDESARGRGVGEALTSAAIARAQSAGARTVDLTSRPSREAANRLYQRVGFEQRATNVYRFTLR
jgi:ribosomal protein S18 acetylase RimI-like enzyme